MSRAVVRPRAAVIGLWTGVGVIALLVRAQGMHRGLIFPDGYDYLLMARGIATHLTPTVALGSGGATFVPSVDAALKPVFPALVALLSPLWGLRGAADAVTVAGGAATVVLAGLLATRLTGSRVAGLTASAAALLSPTLAYWSGYAGPDPAAAALALAAGLSLLAGRFALAGALAALCACTRPEWLVVFLGLGLAGLIVPDSRPAAHRALLAAAFALGGVLAVLRPPIAVPSGGLLLVVAAVLAARFARSRRAVGGCRDPPRRGLRRRPRRRRPRRRAVRPRVRARARWRARRPVLVLPGRAAASRRDADSRRSVS